MAYDQWGASPLYENEDIKEGRIPTVTPIDKVRKARNCGRATDRGKEATSQSCEATNRNLIQDRYGQPGSRDGCCEGAGNEGLNWARRSKYGDFGKTQDARGDGHRC